MAEADEAALKQSVETLTKIVYELTRNEIEMRRGLEEAKAYIDKLGSEDHPKVLLTALQLPDAPTIQKVQEDVVGANAKVNDIGAKVPTKTLEQVKDDLEAVRFVVGARLASH